MKRFIALTTAAIMLGGVELAAPAYAVAGHVHGASGDLPQELIKHAVQGVQHADLNHHLVNLMEHAKGVFIVPGYTSKLLGGSDRQGLLLRPERNSWTPPAFFSIGAMSGTAQKKGPPAPAILLLMTNRAEHAFANAHDLSLAKSGLTARWVSPKVKGGTRTDIVVWSDAKPRPKSLRISGIKPNLRIDRRYYGQRVDTAQILKDKVNNLSSEKLRNALRA